MVGSEEFDEFTSAVLLALNILLSWFSIDKKCVVDKFPSPYLVNYELDGINSC